MTQELKTTTPESSWGDVHASIGKPEANGAMSKSLSDLGSIDTDALTIETADGTVYQLKDINGKLIDELKLEPELTVKFTLLKPSEATRGKFWDVEVAGEGAARKLRVKSLITNEKFSFMFSNPKAIGSETFEAPYCSMSMKQGFTAQKGFTAECTAKLLTGGAGYLFDFGIVDAVPVV